MPRNYAGKRLRGRPFKPEDDLKGANFTGAILRGVNFKGLNLSDANFTNADIRSANFTDAILKNANFTGAQAGLQKCWMWCQFIVIFLFSILLNFTSVLLIVVFTIFLFAPQSIKEYTIFPGLITVIIIATTFVAIARQGLTTKAVGTILATVAVMITFAVAGIVSSAGAVASTGKVAGTLIIAIAFAVAVAGAVASAVASASAVAGVIAGRGAIAIALAVTGVVAIAIALAAEGKGAAVGAAVGAAAGAVAVLSFNFYIAWRTLKGDEKFALAWSLGVALGAIGGTSFCGTNLTAANFTGARLKSANFNNSKQQPTLLHQTCWQESKQLDRARVGTSLLSNPVVRQLLVTGNGYKKSYVEANLYGANLNGVNLEGANLQDANLSHATLQQANLKEANLANTLATSANFTGAYLTGACLEAWNIDHETILKQIDCQFIFLLQAPNPLGSRERRPHNPDKVFQPGDFEKLYRKVMTTVELLLRGGINPEAFTAAFQKLMVEYPDLTPEAIKSIEKRDDAVLVTFQLPNTTDKAKFEQRFDNSYQASLQAQTNAALFAAEQRQSQDLKESTSESTKSLTLPQFVLNNCTFHGSEINMMRSNNSDITAGDGSFINTGPQTLSKSLINLNGTVTNALNGLSDNDPTQAELKSLLTQLQTAIKTDPDLSEIDKNDALEQIDILATLGSNPQQPEKETLGRKAIKILKGTLTMLPSTATLAKAISELIPAITKLIGL
jgi:uncharacterized protein YjbI with pentapeptide repeats